MCRINKGKEIYAVYIQPLSESQEHELDTKEQVFIRTNKSDDGFVVKRENIYCYGEIDLSNDEDIAAIERFNLINSDGASIHSNFNYELGIATYNASENPKFYNTHDHILWYKYCYTIIGKPKRVIIYKTKIY